MLRFLVVLVFAWLVAPAAGHAQSPAAPALAAALADLAGTDAGRREAAVTTLGKTGDPKWLAFLAALREGSVYARKAGGRLEIVVGGTKSTRGDQDVIEIFAAYDRTSLGTVPLGDLSEVAADRVLRLVIKPFLDADETRVQLRDPDPSVRQGAAVKLGNQADAGAVPVVEEALQKGPNRWVRQALAEALAMIRLAHGDGPVRASAATALGNLHAQNALPALRRVAADTGAGAPERTAATTAIRQIERWNLLGNVVPGGVARVDPAPHGSRPGHRVRPDGRHQHGPRRADGPRRLQHLRGAELVPVRGAPVVRRVLPRRAADLVSGGRRGRRDP